ncbi:G-type lectin S-receptor-like serine/threonine-protein kinase SD1-29 [Rosa rugosa]|uniref:G-type lectin S-receptor-like serine/threonine-protein kinase SD1-29 n=1 Tax=Rosa rugosa TaxID=74645 RepID=UPI002B41559D|nr:G-type lectin S-receptor-like serine/threonine-protein kinase SD1-29 [Rosa rugosa]
MQLGEFLKWYIIIFVLRILSLHHYPALTSLDSFQMIQFNSSSSWNHFGVDFFAYNLGLYQALGIGAHRWETEFYVANISVSTNGSAAVLSDNGNFVLKDDMGVDLWQSFDYPSDSLLTNMLLGFNGNSGKRNFLTSWKSENDPSTGIFLVGLSAQTPSQMFIWVDTSPPYWRSGPWDKSKFIGVPEMSTQYLSGFTLDDNVKQETKYFSYTVFDKTIAYLDISSEGITKIMYSNTGENWNLLWHAPKNPCDMYGACGPSGVCKASDTPVCKCLKGFKPKSDEEWSKRNWTEGCVRQTKLFCETDKYISLVNWKRR